MYEGMLKVEEEFKNYGLTLQQESYRPRNWGEIEEDYPVQVG